MSKLIERLRNAKYVMGHDGWQSSVLAIEAADELERLTADRDRIARNRDMWKGQVDRQAADLHSLCNSIRANEGLPTIKAEAETDWRDGRDSYYTTHGLREEDLP